MIRPYQHPVAFDRMRGSGRGPNFVARLLIAEGGLSRSFFTKPRTKRRKRDLHEAINEVLRRRKGMYELVMGESKRRGWL